MKALPNFIENLLQYEIFRFKKEPQPEVVLIEEERPLSPLAMRRLVRELRHERNRF